MTVAELIAALRALPQDAVVGVWEGDGEENGYRYGGYAHKKFDILAPGNDLDAKLVVLKRGLG